MAGFGFIPEHQKMFTIPMRGNEFVRAGELRNHAGRGFTIPMRGNETPVRPTPHLGEQSLRSP